MNGLGIDLLRLYIPLVGWVGLGVGLGYVLPRSIPFYLGKALFWAGVPLSIVAFLRQTDLSESVWVAPIAAWMAMLLGGGLAWAWMRGYRYFNAETPSSPPPPSTSSSDSVDPATWSGPTRGSFLLAAMVGNTGYLGYPVTLTLVGPQYFAWAIFYDTLGSTLGAYGLGVAIAARFGMSALDRQRFVLAILKNPALWSFWLGLAFRTVWLPQPIEQGLQGAAWTVIALSLLLLGMRLSQLTSWGSVQRASISLGIKMLIVPLLIGVGLSALGISGLPQLVIVLQMAMPPAFATLVIAEAYDLDRDLTVTALAVGSLGILVMLPVWLWLFAA